MWDYFIAFQVEDEPGIIRDAVVKYDSNIESQENIEELRNIVNNLFYEGKETIVIVNYKRMGM